MDVRRSFLPPPAPSERRRRGPVRPSRPFQKQVEGRKEARKDERCMDTHPPISQIAKRKKKKKKRSGRREPEPSRV